MLRAAEAKINAAVLALLNIWLILIKIRLYCFQSNQVNCFTVSTEDWFIVLRKTIFAGGYIFSRPFLKPHLIAKASNILVAHQRV